MINSDIVQTRTFAAIAKEITSHVEIEWSALYGSDTASHTELRDIVVDYFIAQKPGELQTKCPNLCEYMLATQHQGHDWHSIALAVDNLNGMYHPLRLTKMVPSND